VAAGQFGEQAAGGGEAHVGAVADGQVAEGLGDVGLADADGAVEDHVLAGVEPAQRGEVADLGGGQLGAGGEVELLHGGLLLEAGAAEAALHGHGLAAGEFVVAQDLEELQVAELAGAGLGKAGVQGVEHAGKLQGAEALVEGGADDGHWSPSCLLGW
jgi:hypothetical protein